MLRKPALAVLPLVALLPLLPLAACNVELGDRAASGQCPAGETCSSATPSGLVFTRTHDAPDMPLSVWGPNIPRPVALGGREQLRFAPNGQGALVAFDAKVTNASFTATADGVDTATVKGAAVGSGYLRITEAGKDLLLDRVEIAVGRVSRVWIGAQEPAPSAPSYAVLAGASAVLVTAPQTADGTWLADDGLGFDGAIAGMQTVLVRAQDGARTVTARTSAGDLGTLDLGVADQIDRVELRSLFDLDTPDVPNLSTGFEEGGATWICGVAWFGTAPVLGADYGFAASSNVQLAPSNIAIANGTSKVCPGVKALTAGPAWVTVTSGGKTFTKNFTIAPKPTATTKAFALAPPTVARGLLGERATAANEPQWLQTR